MAASIKCGERPFKGGVWGGFAPPSQKLGGLGGSAPQPKIFRKFSKKINIFCFSGYGHRGVVIGAGDNVFMGGGLWAGFLGKVMCLSNEGSAQC